MYRNVHMLQLEIRSSLNFTAAVYPIRFPNLSVHRLNRNARKIHRRTNWESFAVSRSSPRSNDRVSSWDLRRQPHVTWWSTWKAHPRWWPACAHRNPYPTTLPTLSRWAFCAVVVVEMRTRNKSVFSLKGTFERPRYRKWGNSNFCLHDQPSFRFD